MLKHILTHDSGYSKIEDVYDKNGILLFTVHYTRNETSQGPAFIIDYVRSHANAPSGPALEAYQTLCEEEKKLNRTPLKINRENDPAWRECKKAARLLLKQGLRSQVKALLREYNKTRSLAES